ncbi:MAG: hypothetical protein ACI91B_004940 [Planctomycetota bacterium]|jgi:hypothetical protein
MLMQALGRSPEIETHQEASHPIMVDHRLISIAQLQKTIEQCPRPSIAIKPLCDSQWLHTLLAHFDNSCAIWMYRNWWDVANSTARKWPGHSLDVIDAFARSDEQWLGWRNENIGEDARTKFDALAAECTTDAAAAATFWWLRNTHFFEHGVAEHPNRARAMRYELLVSQPAEWIRRATDFAQFQFYPAMIEDIHSRSIARDTAPDVPDAVREACDEMLARLVESSEACW